MDDLCRDLESPVDRPVVNETSLEGRYTLSIKAQLDTENDFLEQLRAQTGLLIIPAQRNIDLLQFDLNQ